MKFTGKIQAGISGVPEKNLVNAAILIVLISFLLMVSGCRYYKVATKAVKEPSTAMSGILHDFYPEKRYPRYQYPESNLEKKLWMEYDFYIIDSQGQWSLDGPMTKGDTLFARAVNKPLPPEDNPSSTNYLNSRKFEQSQEERIVKRVKLYVDTLHFWKGDTAMVPIASIQKYDIYKPDARRDIGLSLAVLGGVAFTSLVIAVSIAIANYEPTSTSSCPFIFTYQEESCQFNGEIFSGAIFRSLERDDYLALPSEKVIPGSNYKLKMANLLKEVQYINQAELMLVNHDTSVRVLVDKYGEIQSISEPVGPYLAYDSRGDDVLQLVSENDQRTHNFIEDPDTSISCMNHLDLVFRSHTAPDVCKILVKGHNTLWIDLLAKGIIERLGKNYPYWVWLMDHRSSEKQKEWVLSQGLPLQVYILKGQQWQLADYFDIVGPIAAREMVLPLDVQDAWTEDLSGSTPEYTLNIRLVTGYYAWELDYAALDFSDNARVDRITVQPDWVVDQDSVDVASMILAADRRYLVQETTGDEALMNFTIPDQFKPGGSIFLHAKGYYHSVVEKDGNSELAFIWAFMKPGRLSEYSYENHLKFRDLLTKKE